jgi:molecular chaperone HtpG
MIEALGTIARSGTKAFFDRIQEGKDREEASFIGQFGFGFYSASIVAERVDVTSRHAAAA